MSLETQKTRPLYCRLKLFLFTREKVFSRFYQPLASQHVYSVFVSTSVFFGTGSAVIICELWEKLCLLTIVKVSIAL